MITRWEIQSRVRQSSFSTIQVTIVKKSKSEAVIIMSNKNLSKSEAEIIMSNKLRCYVNINSVAKPNFK